MTKDLTRASATQVKNRFGDYLGEVIYKQEPVIIERHGKPVAVIIDFEEWKKLHQKKEKERHPLMERIDQMNREFLEKHPDAKPFSAVELLNQVRDEEEERLL